MFNGVIEFIRICLSLADTKPMKNVWEHFVSKESMMRFWCAWGFWDFLHVCTRSFLLVAPKSFVCFVNCTKDAAVFCLFKTVTTGLWIGLFKTIWYQLKKNKRCHWFTLSSQDMSEFDVPRVIFWKDCIVPLIAVFTGVKHTLDHYWCDWCVFGVCVVPRICNRSFKRLRELMLALSYTHT